MTYIIVGGGGGGGGIGFTIRKFREIPAKK